MDKKMKIKHQIEEARQVLNNKLSQNILNRDIIDVDILNISWKLDELIVEFIKQGTLYK